MPGTDRVPLPRTAVRLPGHEPHRRRHRRLQRDRRGHRAPAGRRGLPRRRRRPAARPARRRWPTRSARRALPLDVTDPTPRWPRSPAALDRVDVLVNNAGGAFDAEPVADADLDCGQRMYDVNVLGTLRVTKALLPALRRLRRAATSWSSARPPA